MKGVSKADIAGFLSGTILHGQCIAFDDDLLLSGRLDSLGVMALVAYLEEKIDRRIPAVDIIIEHFESIDAIAAYLDRTISE